MGLGFAQADPRQRRVGEHAVGDEPVAGGAVAAGQIVPDDAEIVFRHMGELRTARALADRPEIERARLEPVIDRDISTGVERDTRHLEPDPGGVGASSGRDQDIGAIDGLIA